MRPFDALIFDLGNTLIYFDGEWPEVVSRSDDALLRALQDAGLNLEVERFKAEFRARLETYYREREAEFIEPTTLYVVRSVLSEWGYPQVSEEILRPALRRMYAVSQEHWKLESDAIPVLQTLQAEGYRLGLVSNAGDDEDVQTLIDRSRLRPYFDVIISSAAQGIRKPNPRIFHMALDLLGVSPSRAAMIGDTLGADILGAFNAGLFSIWITRRADRPDNAAHASTIQPDAVLETLAELPNWLQNKATR